jgi:hypothetical protein
VEQHLLAALDSQFGALEMRIGNLIGITTVVMLFCGACTSTKNEQKKTRPNMEHAVIVHLRLSDNKFGTPADRAAMHALRDAIAAAIDKAGAGEFDGDEFGGGECVLFMYGPDVDALFVCIEPVLKSSPTAAGGYAIKRYGEASDPRAREVKVSW